MSVSIQVMEDKASHWAARLLAPITLCEWGAILIYFYFSHRLSALLHPNFHVLVLVTGLLLLASSACALCWEEEAEPELAQECCGADCGHPHSGMSTGRLFAFLVLSVPIVFAAMVSPDSYGSVMVQNRSVAETGKALPGMPSTTQRDAALYKASQHDALKSVEVGDLLIAAQTESGMAQYNGKRIEVTGQFYPLGPRRFEIVRMLMLCCAADAQMLTVQVVSDHDLQLPSMQWANVTGRVGFTKRGDRNIPVVTAENVMAVQRPGDPFVYHGGSLPAAPRSNFKLQLPPR